MGGLAQDRLLHRQNNVFWGGPIANNLSPGVEEYVKDVLNPFPKKEWDGINVPYLIEQWISTLCRILISIRRYGHGGALLITSSHSDLDIKYPVHHSPLQKALSNLRVLRQRAHKGFFE